MQKTLSYHIAALYRDFLGYTDDLLKKQDISHGLLPFIIYAGKHPECSQAEMTKALSSDWGHCQRSITKLVDNGFMTKEKAVGKGKYKISLTSKGEEVFSLSHDIFSSWDEENLSVLSGEEREELVFLLGRVLKNVRGNEDGRI